MNIGKTMLLLFVVFSVLYAQGSSSADIKEGLERLQETTKATLLVVVFIEGIIGIVLLGAAALIYFKKIKGAEKKETLWLIAAAILALVGVFFLLGAVFGAVSYFTMPLVTESLVGPY